MGLASHGIATGEPLTDLYEILGLKRTAGRKDIHKAYRRKAKTAHPDSGGTVEAFNELVTAYAVLSDAERRAKYDETGEIDPPRPDNFDGGAIEIIAEKLGLVIHAEHDLAAMDVGALIEQAIRQDIADRKGSITHQKRAAERLAALRARTKRKGQGRRQPGGAACSTGTSSPSRTTSRSTRKRSASWSGRWRSWRTIPSATIWSLAQAEEVSGALNDILVALDELAAILNTSPARADAMPQGAGPTAFG